MSLNWTAELAVDHALIDAQHQQLFSRFEAFIAACDQRRGLAELRELLDYLDGYIQSHFAVEETLMQALDYPRHAHHLEEHRRFAERIAELQRVLQQSGESVPVLVLTSKALVYWLTEHIRHVDQELASLLRTANKTA